MDSYEVSQEIMKLYQKHVNKSSGEINKDDLKVPIFFFDSNWDYTTIGNISFVEGVGIILEK